MGEARLSKALVYGNPDWVSPRVWREQLCSAFGGLDAVAGAGCDAPDPRHVTDLNLKEKNGMSEH